MTKDYQQFVEFASVRDLDILDALKTHGTWRKAAAALNLSTGTISDAMERLERRAARMGKAEGHFNSGVAPGYIMGKVTVQRDKLGEVLMTWERQSPEAALMAEAMRAAAAAMAEDLPRAKPVRRQAQAAEALCNVYTLTDCHVGMLAWHREGGADWDLKIAEATLVGCFEHMVRAAPPARLGFVNQLGDFLHYDSMSPVTPTSGHVVDADGRFSKMVGAAIRILRRIIACALERHEKVVVLLAEGNHDLASSVWLRVMFKALYENEPRVEVIDSDLPYYAYQHGETMLAFHHGHLKKKDQLPLLFAAQFHRIWGATTKRYCHVGHWHHVDEREYNGMTVRQHPTLAARDAYAARGGYFAERNVTAITYHVKNGEVARNTVTPEMLEPPA